MSTCILNNYIKKINYFKISISFNLWVASYIVFFLWWKFCNNFNNKPTNNNVFLVKNAYSSVLQLIKSGYGVEKRKKKGSRNLLRKYNITFFDLYMISKKNVFLYLEILKNNKFSSFKVEFLKQKFFFCCPFQKKKKYQNVLKYF